MIELLIKFVFNGFECIEYLLVLVLNILVAHFTIVGLFMCPADLLSDLFGIDFTVAFGHKLALILFGFDSIKNRKI